MEQHWDFTWAEEGIYDVPALVEKMIETTGHPKVTMMGYSTGGAQMFYGLAKRQDWFAERVNRFVGLSACQYMRLDTTYEKEVLYYTAFDRLGVYNFWGKDASTLSSETCKEVSPTACGFVGFAPPYDGQALPVKSFMYYTQIALEGRFQEPQSLEKWAAGERYTEPVDLTKIDRVPVSIVHSVSDETCDPVMIEWTYAQVQSPDKHIRFEHGGHSLYNYETKSSFVDRMV